MKYTITKRDMMVEPRLIGDTPIATVMRILKNKGAPIKSDGRAVMETLTVDREFQIESWSDLHTLELHFMFQRRMGAVQ